MKVNIKLKKEVKTVSINTEYIRLDSLLKFSNAVSTGGIAKMVILDELVKLNGNICTSRGKKVYKGDFVEYNNVFYKVV